MMNKSRLYMFFTMLIMLISMPAYAAWEAGAKAGYDSNVNRTIDGAVGDTYLGGYLQYLKEADGETSVGWSFAAALELNTFLKNNDLSNALLTLAPGVTYFPYLSWNINISPFVQGKVSADEDQSALAFGAKISLKQPINKNFYIGEYYVFTDSRAQEDVYSSADHALGVYLGMNWTDTFFTEVGYEYSQGDSFVTYESSVSGTTSVRGRGRSHSYSSTFTTEIYKDSINRHSVGLTVGAELLPSVVASLSYIYSTTSGDMGTFDNHAGQVGIGYRF